MKTNRYALIAVATLAAALSAAPAFAKNGKFDVFTDGAKVAKFDPYTDGARAGKFDTYAEGAKYDTTTDRAPL
ncbi:hypothetical protein LJR296_003701 [Cupriavidus necator]|jgi:hypothetical protein|uniref:hypothetical protein n=1 Tax=Cupriavidus necator TaxID=106590 RepID=UPI003ECDFEF6